MPLVAVIWSMFEPLHNETRENRQTVVSDVFTRGGCTHSAKCCRRRCGFGRDGKTFFTRTITLTPSQSNSDSTVRFLLSHISGNLLKVKAQSENVRHCNVSSCCSLKCAVLENILRQRTTPTILQAKRVCNQGGSNVYSLLLEVKDRNAKRTDGISPGLGNRYGQRAIRRPF